MKSGGNVSKESLFKFEGSKWIIDLDVDSCGSVGKAVAATQEVRSSNPVIGKTYTM